MPARIHGKDIKSDQITKRHLKSASGWGEVPSGGTITANYTATIDDALLPVSGTVTISLPSISSEGVLGKRYFIKNLGTNIVTVDPSGSETIDGQTTIQLTAQYDDMQIIATSLEWNIL